MDAKTQREAARAKSLAKRPSHPAQHAGAAAVKVRARPTRAEAPARRHAAKLVEDDVDVTADTVMTESICQLQEQKKLVGELPMPMRPATAREVPFSELKTVMQTSTAYKSKHISGEFEILPVLKTVIALDDDIFATCRKQQIDEEDSDWVQVEANMLESKAAERARSYAQVVAVA